MARRIIEVDGIRWEVSPTGRTTQYLKDEFGLVFTRIGPQRERRFLRFTPRGAKSRETALNELTDPHLHRMLAHSQPSWTAPELGYQR